MAPTPVLQHDILIALFEREPYASGELAIECGCHTSAMSRALGILRAKGLVDKEYREYYLTNQGRQMAGAMLAPEEVTV